MRLTPSEASKRAIEDLQLPIYDNQGAALISYAIHLMLDSDKCGVSLYDMTGNIKDFNTVIYNRRDFYLLQQEAERGRVAMKFVDRAGDVHPGIDDADKICTDFYNAMIEVLEKQWGR